MRLIDKSKLNLGSQFRIWENYNGSFIRFQVITEDLKVYSLQFSDDELIIKEKPINNSLNFFDENIENGETNCFHYFTALPNKIQIFSKYNQSSESFQTYRISLSN